MGCSFTNFKTTITKCDKKIFQSGTVIRNCDNCVYVYVYVIFVLIWCVIALHKNI